MLKIVLTAATMLACLSATATAKAAESVLDHVRAARTLTCGVLTEPEDYTKDDLHGPLDDFGGEICKAVAVAVLGPAASVGYLAIPDEAHGLAAAVSGRIDLFATASPGRANAQGDHVGFGPTVFVDGQGFLVRRDDGITTLHDLDGRQVCFIGGTRQETVLHAAEAREGISVLPFPFEEVGEMEAALVSGHCAAMTADVSMLADARGRFHALVRQYVVLPVRLTADPVAPAYRAGDPRWAAIVGAVVGVLHDAQARGITQRNVATQALDGGEVPGLSAGWATHVIAAVGNIDEIDRRTLGAGINASDVLRAEGISAATKLP